mmetsp:Transcript_1943/g.4545  ORF Transcript_1943/g.4545 Transcript_1943/m.4545 type:complete len:304 (-) Transcript_1943:27-938(-)
MAISSCLMRPSVDSTVESTDLTTCFSTSLGCTSESASTAATDTPETLSPTTSNLSLMTGPAVGTGASGCSATMPSRMQVLLSRGICHLHSRVVLPKTAVAASPEVTREGAATMDSGIGKITSTFSAYPSVTLAVMRSLQMPPSNMKCGLIVMGGLIEVSTLRSTLKLHSSMTCSVSGMKRMTCSVLKAFWSMRGCSLHSSKRKSFSSHRDILRVFMRCVSAVMWHSSSHETISPRWSTSMSKSSISSSSTSSLERSTLLEGPSGGLAFAVSFTRFSSSRSHTRWSYTILSTTFQSHESCSSAR